MAMQLHNSPGVFINDVTSVSRSAGVEAGVFTMAFVGIAQTGPVGIAVPINSWPEYLNVFARGLETPFMLNSYLAYSVYGFFQNGGRRCYVVRVVGTAAVGATATLDGEDTAVVRSKYPGEWANDLTLSVVLANTLYDFTVSLKGVAVEKFTGLSTSSTSDMLWSTIINEGSNYITVTTPGTITPSATITFTGGNSDLSTVTDATYTGPTGAVHALDDVEDFNVIAIPGQTSSVLQTALLTFCKDKGRVFAILDSAESATPENAKTARATYDSHFGELAYPWIKVFNPLSTTTVGLRNCPPSGHLGGVVARFVDRYGSWRAPAGTEAELVGAMDVVRVLTNAELDALNAANINCIVARPNYGIVMWGARTLTKSRNRNAMKYVSDSLLNFHIKQRAYEIGQPFVFEPNNAHTRLRFAAELESLLDPMWRAGAFTGAKKEEAYFVRCDETNNTAETVAQGKLIAQVGYAPTTPGEFVVVDISNDLQV